MKRPFSQATYYRRKQRLRRNRRFCCIHHKTAQAGHHINLRPRLRQPESFDKSNDTVSCLGTRTLEENYNVTDVSSDPVGLPTISNASIYKVTKLLPLGRVQDYSAFEGCASGAHSQYAGDTHNISDGQDEVLSLEFEDLNKRPFTDSEGDEHDDGDGEPSDDPDNDDSNPGDPDYEEDPDGDDGPPGPDGDDDNPNDPDADDPEPHDDPPEDDPHPPGDDPEDDDDPDDPDPPDPGQNPPPDDDDDLDDGEVTLNFSLVNPFLNRVCRILNDCTVREVLALLLAIGSRDSLTYDALIRLFKAFNCICGRKFLPVDKKEVWFLLGRNRVGIRKFVYCTNCLRGHGRLRDFHNDIICPCGKVVRRSLCKVFISLNLMKQVSELLMSRKVRAGLQYRQARQVRIAGSMEDILDGSQYRHLREPGNVLSAAYNYSYTFNLDGFRLSKSSTTEAWPIFLRWNELPRKLRQRTMILAGVWVDLRKPNMQLFLEQFVQDANNLSNEGVAWQPQEGEEVRSRFIPTCCVADAKARCELLNLQPPTGYYGCPNCTHAGLYVGGAVHFPYLPPVPFAQRRTHDDIQRCMVEATETGRVIEGLKGVSQLVLMDYFDLGKGLVTDDIHPFSGVIKCHFEILMTRTREYEPPYYIGSGRDVRRINSRLLSIRTPTCISRKPRIISTRKQWNCSEWRNFLLYYCVPCLDGILPNRYLRHLEMLAQAIFIVSRDIVSQFDCDVAHDLFQGYVRRFEQYFGREKMLFNIHILLHVVDCVREWGPMYAQSTSFFESWNHDLMKTVTSPHASADQIVTRYLIRRFLNNVEEDEHVSDRVKAEVDVILNNPRLRDSLTIGNVQLLGKSISRPPNVMEYQALLHENIEIHRELIVYKRALLDSVEYRSSDYLHAGVQTKSDNSHILTWDDEFAQIRTIAVLLGAENRVVFFTNVLNTNAHRNRYVSLVDVGQEVLILIHPADIRGPAIRCNVTAGQFVMPISSTCELD